MRYWAAACFVQAVGDLLPFWCAFRQGMGACCRLLRAFKQGMEHCRLAALGQQPVCGLQG